MSETTPSGTGESNGTRENDASAPPAPIPGPPPAQPDATAALDANATAAQAPVDVDDSPWSDPDKAKREIERLRKENGDARVNAKKSAADEARSEILKQMSAMLDPNSKGEELTAEQITAKLGETSSELDGSRRELAITREAWASNIDPAKIDYLNYVLARREDVRASDPASAEFSGTLATAIKEEIAKDSSLRLSGAASGTGSPQFGGAGDSGAMSKAEFSALPYAKRVELYNTNRAEYERLVNA